MSRQKTMESIINETRISFLKIKTHNTTTELSHNDKIELYSKIELSSKIAEKLFQHNIEGSLSPESKIFLICGNSFGHIYNIVSKLEILSDEKSINYLISEELDLIYQEMANKDIILDKLSNIERIHNNEMSSNLENSTLLNKLLHMEERLKQLQLENYDKLHGHMHHLQEVFVQTSDNLYVNIKEPNKFTEMFDGLTKGLQMSFNVIEKKRRDLKNRVSVLERRSREDSS